MGLHSPNQLGSINEFAVKTQKTKAHLQTLLNRSKLERFAADFRKREPDGECVKRHQQHLTAWHQMSRTTWWILSHHCNIPWKLHHRRAHSTDRRRQTASKLKHSFVCQQRHRRDKASHKNEPIHNVFCAFSWHAAPDVLNVYVLCVESRLKF